MPAISEPSCLPVLYSSDISFQRIYCDPLKHCLSYSFLVPFSESPGYPQFSSHLSLLCHTVFQRERRTPVRRLSPPKGATGAWMVKVDRLLASKRQLVLVIGTFRLQGLSEQKYNRNFQGRSRQIRSFRRRKFRLNISALRVDGW